MSRPEIWWACKHLFIAPKAYRLTNLARNHTLQVMKDSMLDHDPNGGQVDAFRHTYWMALLAMHFNASKVTRLGVAHEKGNYIDFKKGRIEDGMLPDKISSAMDLFNNQKGIEIGQANKKMDKEALASKIIALILEGQMRVIIKNKSGDYLDCEGNLINLDSYKKTWFIPKCLVRSSYQVR